MDDAKTILQARRPGHRDADDPRFDAALAQAKRDPRLAAWHEREQRFDTAVAMKLAETAPPAGLREAILAEAQELARQRAWWRQPQWLGWAAAVLVVLALGGRFVARMGVSELEELAVAAARDLAAAHDRHTGQPKDLAAVLAPLVRVGRPLREAAALDVDELRRGRCRALRIAGRDVFELCFRRDGVGYHLYISRGPSRDGADGFREAADGRVQALAWSDARNTYVLVTAAGREALRRVW